jgi:hypothetical protein
MITSTMAISIKVKPDWLRFIVVLSYSYGYEGYASNKASAVPKLLHDPVLLFLYKKVKTNQ